MLLSEEIKASLKRFYKSINKPWDTDEIENVRVVFSVKDPQLLSKSLL